tara:strand:+ start:221 stop:1168 length:948 start_codon:yes stop_codon:yes gene_type:complete
MAYKYKLSEMSKTASEEDAAKELKRKPGEKFKVGQVTYADDGTSKSTITDIDPVTGAVKWRIDQLPGFDKLYDEITDLVTTAKRTYVKTKDDKKFREFYDDIRVIRNKIRTHLRNEYPDQYKRITRVSENEVDEISTSGAAGAYNTPYAFRKKGQKADDEAYKELGYKEVNEKELTKKDIKDLKKVSKQLKGAVKSHGKQAKTIDKAINEVIDLVHVYDKDGKIFGTGEIEKELPNDKVRVRFDGNFVGTFRADRVKPVQEGVGADLGPGPKAGPDGVTDSAYTKQFKYKLVPKTKDGTYVQKGSTMPVRKLWGS